MVQSQNSKVSQWLAEHRLVPEESFACALKRLCQTYQKKNNIRCLDEIYRKIGIRKEYIYYWMNHPYSVRTKNFQV